MKTKFEIGQKVKLEATVRSIKIEKTRILYELYIGTADKIITVKQEVLEEL